ncbi:hypothetical protein [Vibrio sp. SCSIO 43136]|uniref:hypothetical protein n=1 Tax=Vibrio sp. SCSIO 43136 TaxID=2819101 RepID=UPI00207631FE|nr:hypothetical protein [Vibrio sp. SCSIO 43136]USD67280.1 hypothetical protein J4N39_21860 [Vibrio sp. SCSIO 43136]
MSEYDRNRRRKFGLLVSVTFSLTMNLIFLTAYQQPFNVLNWAMQLPLTIPAGALVGIGVSIFIAKYTPHWSHHLKALLFSLLMSVVMSLIMVPFALIPRVGLDFALLFNAILVGVPVGMITSYLVVPLCHWVVYKRYSMPELGVSAR